MEAQTDIQTYLERGKQALAQGHGRDAAIAYAYAAQLEPDNPMVHLGLAEANLALGNYGVVMKACRKVQELQSASGIESKTAQALLDLLDRRYQRALQSVDAIISEDPGIAYVHALRAHLYRAMGQSYDANLARARATRLSYGGRFENTFPPLEPEHALAEKSNGNPSPSTERPSEEEVRPTSQARMEPREQVPTWQRNNFQRQVIRTRFMLSQHPGWVTYTLMGINVIVFILSFMFSAIDQYGTQVNVLVSLGQYWRIFTAMFLHNDVLHIALNMLSLFFIGRAVEDFFGPVRYVTIYLLSGICGGLAFYFFMPPMAAAVGASGAVFGVFGALGTLYITHRRFIGQGAIVNWIFWLGLNLVFGFSGANIAIWGHIGGLVGGMIISYFLMPRQRGRFF